jgi:hypothetical protein
VSSFVSSKAVRSTWLLAILLCACAPSRRAWQPREPIGESEYSAYAVVLASTPLSIAPSSSAPQTFALARERIFNPVLGPAFVAFRMVRTENGWAELETLGARGPHCAESFEALDALRVRFFVPARALVPITTREIEQSFPDGSEIELSRGVPVEPLPGTPLVRVFLGSTRTVLRVSPADYGTRYLPSEGAAYGPSAVVIAREALAAAVPILGQTGRVEGSEALAVYDQENARSEVLAEIRPRCARLVVRVPAQTLIAAPGPNEAPAPERPAPAIRAGAHLSWRDGTDAGRAAREARFDRESEPAGDRRCFVRSIEDATVDGAAFIELCVARADVIDPNARPASLLEDPR